MDDNGQTMYEIRQIDAWRDIENSWTYNETWHVTNFVTRAEDHSRAFLNALHKSGIVCKRGACVVYDDGEILELQSRKTHEPYFVAIPQY